jgi:hypothetical protein
MAWNREHAGEAWPGEAALGWSAAAMGDAARRLEQARGLDLPQALAVVSEAVWWVTLVDATVVRYCPDAYDRVLAGLGPGRAAGGGGQARRAAVRAELDGLSRRPGGFLSGRGRLPAAVTCRSRSGRGCR